MTDSPKVPSSDPSSERRQEERISGRIEVRFKEERAAALALRAYSVNFSSGGLCLKTQKSYEIGAALSLSIAVEGRELEVRAVVAWARGDVIGVRFEGLSTEAKAQLAALAARFESKG